MNRILAAVETNPREGGPSFSLRNRLFRAAWGVTWALLGSWTPAPFHGWRRALARCFGARIDPTAKIYPGVKIWHPGNLEMAAFATLGPCVNCYDMALIRLEPYALVSQGAHLCAGSHNIDDPSFQLFAKPITIGRNAWVAAEAFVGPGVTVGDGAVLGARSVAMKNLEVGWVHVGNPCRPIRQRKGVGRSEDR